MREILQGAVTPKEAAGKGSPARKGKERKRYRSTAWRRQRIDGIIDRCARHVFGVRMKDYIAARFGAVLLIELSDTQLQHVYRTVARWAIALQTPFKASNKARFISQTK